MTEMNWQEQSPFLLIAMTVCLTVVPSFVDGLKEFTLAEKPEFGSLIPDIEEGEYLALFYFEEVENPYELTLIFNEYYMSHVNVSICTEDLLDIMEHPGGYSEQDVLSRCNYYDISCHIVVSFGVSSLDMSRYLNITIPPRRQYLHPLPDLLDDRPLFNITYYYGPQGPVEDIFGIQENYLLYCNLNGVPTVYEDEQGKFSLGCECRGNTSGDRCQWGGACSRESEAELCSNHGYCRYQAGQVVCICDPDYVGSLCQNRKEALVSKGKDCGRRLNCQHNCHMWNGSPFCTCDLGFTKNGTRCDASKLLWDVTLKFEGQYNSSSIKTQIHNVLTKHGLPESRVVISPNFNCSREEAKAHFTVEDQQLSKLPPKDEWDAIFNTSVTLDKQMRFQDVKLTADATDSSLTLQCSVIGTPPLQFRWYKDSHLILVKDVTDESRFVDYEAVLVRVQRGTYGRIFTMVVDLKNYDPVIDWGTYTCEVTSENETNRSSSVVSGMTRPFEMEVSPKVVVVEKNDDLKVLCSTKNMWYGGNHYSVAWKVFPEDTVGNFTPRLLHWRGSELTLSNITESVHLNCYMKDYSCLGEGAMSSQVLVLGPKDLYCPATELDGIKMPAMIEGESAIVNCPDGFVGKCQGRCHKFNEKVAKWGDLDCSLCIYAPWNEIATSDEVILQGRGYPYAVQDARALAEQFYDRLQNRTLPVLRDELQGVLNFLGKFITSNQNPVRLERFVSIVDNILEEFPPSIESTMALRNIIRKYLDNNIRLHKHRKRERGLYFKVYLGVNLTRGSPFSFIMRSPCRDVSVNISRSKGDNTNSVEYLNVGIVTYLGPHLLFNTTWHKKTLDGAELPVELLDNCIVDVMTFPDEEVTIHFTYKNYQQAEVAAKLKYDTNIYSWSKVCGEIKLIGSNIEWNFSQCRDPEENSAAGELRCQCRGMGLFGVFMKAALIDEMMINQEDVTTSIVAAAYSIALLILLLFAICLMMFCWPRLSSTNRNFGWDSFSEETENTRGHLDIHERRFQHLSPNRLVDRRDVICSSSHCITSGTLYYENNNDSANQDVVIVADETDSAYMNMDSAECDKGVFNITGLKEVHTYVNMTSNNCTSITAKQEYVSTNEGQSEPQHLYLPMQVRKSEIEQEQN
ncbi:uncharacterized protein LOC135218486 isoform X2 [Macrobrachium nipponense]|uniref:uncharacterized protein LOC135218486 isoform X2 n=1 Tax=Macrobrachium nipponense TaxID=159736 RepID=UPI0030C8A009